MTPANFKGRVQAIIDEAGEEPAVFKALLYEAMENALYENGFAEGLDLARRSQMPSVTEATGG